MEITSKKELEAARNARNSLTKIINKNKKLLKEAGFDNDRIQHYIQPLVEDRKAADIEIKKYHDFIEEQLSPVEGLDGISNWVKALKSLKGWSQGDIGDILGKSQTTMSRHKDKDYKSLTLSEIDTLIEEANIGNIKVELRQIGEPKNSKIKN